MKHRLVQLVVALPAALFLFTGIRWLVDPAAVAPQFGVELGTGLGLSTQVGDLSAFFLTLGGTIVVALMTGQKVWYYPAVALLLLAALGRLIAWAFHGAAITPMIAVELVVAGLLVWAALRREGGAR